MNHGCFSSNSFPISLHEVTSGCLTHGDEVRRSHHSVFHEDLIRDVFWEGGVIGKFVENEIMNRRDEGNPTSRGASAEPGRSALRGASFGKEGSIEVRSVEEGDAGFLKGAGEEKLLFE